MSAGPSQFPSPLCFGIGLKSRFGEPSELIADAGLTRLSLMRTGQASHCNRPARTVTTSTHKRTVSSAGDNHR